MHNNKEHYGPHGTKRDEWRRDFSLDDPLDWGLAIPDNIKQKDIPTELLQIFSRFYHEGLIQRYGGSCVIMANLLRRILRLHGIEAFSRQTIFQYENRNKGWKVQTGTDRDIVPEGKVDVHMVCVSQGFVLDFAQTPLHQQYGMQAPICFIGLDDPNSYNGPMQNFGKYGVANWHVKRPKNDFVRHILYNNRELILKETKEYFYRYKMKPYLDD